MSFEARLRNVLQRLAESERAPAAEREAKQIIVGEIDDGDKLETLIGCLGDGFAAAGKRGQSARLRLLLSIAEVFQYQIVEFLPKMFEIALRAVRDDRHDFAEQLSETVGGVAEFAYKEADFEAARASLEIALPRFLALLRGDGRTAAALSVAPLVGLARRCPSPLLAVHFEDIYAVLFDALSNADGERVVALLEALLALLIAVQEKASFVARSAPEMLVQRLADEDPKVRKLCLDIFHALLAIDRGALTALAAQLAAVFDVCRGDKSKAVRQSANDCLRALNEKGAPRPTRESNRESELRKPRRLVVSGKRPNFDHIQSRLNKCERHEGFFKNGGDAIIVVAPSTANLIAASESLATERPIVSAASQTELESAPRTDDSGVLRKHIKLLHGKVTALEQLTSELKEEKTRLETRLDELERNMIFISERLRNDKESPSARPPSKWSRPAESVSESLFAVLAAQPSHAAEPALVRFLRLPAHLAAFGSIEASLLAKLFDRLCSLVGRSASTDFIVAEYGLKWLEAFLEYEKIGDVETAKRLNSLFVYLVNTAEDEEIKQTAFRLSQHRSFEPFYEFFYSNQQIGSSNFLPQSNSAASLY